MKLSMFTFYSYISKNLISQINFKGIKNSKTIKILGYKVSGKPTFTTLLRI